MENNKHFYRVRHFDSSLFGYKVAKLTKRVSGNNLGAVLKHLKALNATLIYWFVDPVDENANIEAINHNGILVDKKVTYVIDHMKYKRMAEDNNLVHSYHNTYVSPEIVSLALQSGIYSRFSIDRNFAHDEYKKLYSIWIKKSVLHQIAFDVIVYVDESESMKGIMSLESKSDNGCIGLFAVDKRFRGKSIGKTLVKKAFAIFDKRRYKKVFVTTQGNNTIACRFYEKLGFVKYKTENVYHFWL